MAPLQILIYVALAVFVLWRVVIRQVRGSTLTTRRMVLVPALLLVIGAADCVPELPHASAAEIAFTAVDLLVLAPLGIARGVTTRVSERDGYAFQKGGTPTLVLWLATVAIRVGLAVLGAHFGALGALTTASLWLSLGLSLAIQNAVIGAKARRAGLTIATDASALALQRR
ncbi:DUF1453 family protein [Amycolatopsis cynarae]|uniref:DUF1453 family protein n=1 Tax=Amycolatopsis cynarae TaxID=2995223 RepID=A0ABY7B7P1_9PSEU|nr:CcdC protein domain-containing protein [Amycolatopsis sp. HUAS 11-8]WAL67434.1 DUF1453 family protein [Amycolatopsis sp. HUAS 11-8]